jgi:hypothetical protein
MERGERPTRALHTPAATRPSLPRREDRSGNRGCRIFLCGHAAAGCLRDQPGGNKQWSLGTFERPAKSLDGALVDLAVFYELRKVVDKAGVDHAVGSRCSAA